MSAQQVNQVAGGSPRAWRRRQRPPAASPAYAGTVEKSHVGFVERGALHQIAGARLVEALGGWKVPLSYKRVSANQAAAENGLPAEDILILERDGRLGGILNQCIHNGFGLHTFKEELTGPEYAARFEERAKALHIPYKLGAMVLSISPEKVVTAVSREDGLRSFGTLLRTGRIEKVTRGHYALADTSPYLAEARRLN